MELLCFLELKSQLLLRITMAEHVTKVKGSLCLLGEVFNAHLPSFQHSLPLADNLRLIVPALGLKELLLLGLDTLLLPRRRSYIFDRRFWR